MTYTCEEIQKLEHPYQELGSSDSLAEHHTELNKLNEEQKIAVASRMVLDCPNEEMKGFRHVIEAANTTHRNDQDTFYPYLSQAYEVKQRLVALTDLRNKAPHLLLLDKEFDDELFTKFNTLALNVVNKCELSIAVRLAQSTPEKNRSQIARNLNNVFRETVFAGKVSQAFAISRDIERLLLGDKPYDFFNSREYNHDACVEFSELFNCTKGKESSIAAKLALSTPTEKRSAIAGLIKTLSPEGELTSRTSAAFELQRNIELTLLGDNPEQFFTSPAFDADLCLEFAELFPPLLKGKEQLIGEKLSCQEQQVIAEIGRKLEWINPNAANQDSTFRLIASAMTNKKESALKAPSVRLQEPTPTRTDQTTKSPSSRVDTEKPAMQFQHSLFDRKSSTPLLATIREEDSDEEENEESSCSHLCGFW
ncbi:hypothetical protein [Legionella waltersii]|uniref:Uncharacterized protein n=1 Tax=Legionella waltersii TaxID=66969 RepID=A0A0W1A5M5_9GAMM|nr:hypothetical protein [Legionella waltersii]KTD76496.1 hypothetical protein Lwal_2218 [Legionella waltersii]SNU93736.1 Uncharacterised protein [Legionella waltersii]